MYTKIDLIENKKMDEIIKDNFLKTRKFNEKKEKKNRIKNTILNLILGISFYLMLFAIINFLIIANSVMF